MVIHEEHRDNLVDVIQELMEDGSLDEAVSILANRHPADQADLLEHLDEEERFRLINKLPSETAAEVLEHMGEAQRRTLLAEISPRDLAPIIDEAEDDVAADIIQDLAPDRQEQVLPLLEYREDIEELLVHDEESAGGMMTPDIVTVQVDWTVQETIDYLRRIQPDSSQTYYVYVIDAEEHLKGVLSFRDLIVAQPATRVDSIMRPNVISVEADFDREAAAELVRHYNLMVLPVLDDEGRILGVITADDVIDVQSEEATEDIYKMAGVGVKEWVFSPVLESARRRVPWLGFNMVWAFAGALIISLFQGTIQKVAAVAIFMPMIAGQAGNAGIQTATIVVRSMALGEVGIGDAFRVLRKEWVLGLIKGSIFGTILGVIAFIAQGSVYFGLVAGVAMFLNMIVAATAGVIVPMTLRRFGIDPATIAGVFDTMVTDFMGFLIYLGLATLLLSKLT